MARKPTKAQQELYDLIASSLPDDEIVIDAIASLVEGMRDSECIDIIPRIKSGILDRIQQIYQDMKSVPAKESAYLSIMFMLLTDKATDRYWKSSPEIADAKQKMLTLFLNTLQQAGYQVPAPAYFTVTQTEMTNALTEISRTGGFQFLIDSNDAIAETGKGRSKIKYYFKDAMEYGTLKTQDIKLLDFLLFKFHQMQRQEMAVSIEEFCDWTGRKYTRANRQEMREEVGASLNRLKGISADYIGRSRRKTRSFGSVSLCGGTAFVDHGGVIRWNWNTSIIEELTHDLIPLDYAAETAKLPNTGNSFYISRYLDIHYRRNEGKPNELTVSIAKLIEVSRNLPTIDEVKQRRGSAKQKIIDPFFRDLDRLDRFVFTIIDKDGNVIEPEDITSYDEFIKCKVVAEFEDESIKPVHPARVKARNARKKKEQNAKKSS